MKFKLLLITLIFSFTICAQIQSGKVTYVVSMAKFSDKKIDSLLSKRKSKNVRANELAKSFFKNTPNVNAYLDFVNGESMYYVEEKLEVDGKPTFNMNRIFAGGDNKIYQNTKTKEYLKENIRENLLIEKEEKKWQITQESKQIGKYLCFKAIDIESTNKKMKPIVWFTPQIPVSFGPLEYNGLPGLVILVEMSQRTISASKIILNPKEKIKFKKLIKGERVSEKKYDEKMKTLWNGIKRNKQ